MDASKKAVQEFLARDGQNDTTVHETVAPAVVHEHVTRTEHQEVVTAVEREVHQDHYHTSIQPIQDREILPEVHSHVMKDVVTREFHHGSDGKILQGIEAERAQFKNTREIGDLQHTYAETPMVAAEHVHHHVHETIQPVVDREVLQHTVHHTVVPIHEVHHNEAKFEGVTALKPLTMAEFQASGGVLGPHGKNAKIDHFATEANSSGATPTVSKVASPAQPNTTSTATSRALDSATANTSSHTRGSAESGSVSNLETKTERKFPLASGDAASSNGLRSSEKSLPIRSANNGANLDSTPTKNVGFSTQSPTITTTTTTNTSTHSNAPIRAIQEATPRSVGNSNTMSPAATSDAKRGGADYGNSANHTTAGAGVSPTASRKSVDASRKSLDAKGRKSVDAGRRSGETEQTSGKKEGFLKRIIHKLE